MDTAVASRADHHKREPGVANGPHQRLWLLDRDLSQTAPSVFTCPESFLVDSAYLVLGVSLDMDWRLATILFELAGIEERDQSVRGAGGGMADCAWMRRKGLLQRLGP